MGQNYRQVRSAMIIGRLTRGLYRIRIDSGEIVAGSSLAPDVNLSTGAKVIVAETEGNYQIIAGYGFQARAMIEVMIDG